MQDTLQTLSVQLDAIARQLHRTDVAERLQKVSANQQNNGISLAVLGRLGSGKSTLINALLGREVLPTNNALIPQSDTIITIAQVSKAIVNFANGEKKTVSPAPAALLNVAKSGGVVSLAIQYPSDQWENGARIVEVPGIDSPYQGILTRILAQANAVIYVMDIRQALSKEEQMLLTRISSHITKCIIALTKIDQVASDEQDEAFRSATQRIEELHLPIKVEIYKVVPQILLKGEYHPSLYLAWEEFKHAALKIAPAPFTLPPSNSMQINALNAITKDLQSTLVQSNAQPVVSSSAQSGRGEHNKTYELLVRVITDQTNDIEQTLKDSFSAFLFTLQDDLKARRISPDFVEERANAWLDKEKTRIETRFRRLYTTVLEDAGRALGRELKFSPDMLPMPPIQYRTAATQEASPSFLANMSKEQQSILIGGVAVAIIGGLLSGPLGWTMLVLGTTGAAGVTLYIVVGQKYVGGRANQSFDGIEMPLPEGIEKNIQHNSKRLKDFLATTFQDTNVVVNNTKPGENELNISLQDQLREIQTKLEHMSN